MNIVHINKFFYLKGGPERYVFSVSNIQKEKGNKIAFFSMKHKKNMQTEWSNYFVENIDYQKKQNMKGKLSILAKTVYSREAEEKLLKLINDFTPDIAHIHNFSHQLSPSVILLLRRWAFLQWLHCMIISLYVHHIRCWLIAKFASFAKMGNFLIA